MAITFELIHTCKQTGARYGKIHTPSGTFETPIFMPVGTQATVKSLAPEEILEVSEGLILANTYHLWSQPGMEVIQAHGNVKKMMQWDHALLTDSGGYQVFSLSDMRKIKEEGVYFKHHKNGSPLFMSPEISIDLQQTIGADIIMSFDECPSPHESRDYLKDSLERTLRWAQRGKDYKTSDQALFGIVQGGLMDDLRLYSAEKTMEIGFDGYSIGGLSVGESKEEMYRITTLLKDVLPKDKPRYLMGVGAPEDLVMNVMNGIDMFDCVLPTRLARHGTALTTEGKVILKSKRYEFDLTPLDQNLKSLASPYTKSYLRHLYKAEEMLVARLVSIQNLAYLKHLMKEIRQAIQEDRLHDYYLGMKSSTNYFK
jgi:queuine tRNA-ribosyltransferase